MQYFPSNVPENNNNDFDKLGVLKKIPQLQMVRNGSVLLGEMQRGIKSICIEGIYL
jgi:hypothetical protein